MPHVGHREDLSLPCNQREKENQLVKMVFNIKRQNLSALEANKNVMTNDMRKKNVYFPPPPPNKHIHIHSVRQGSSNRAPINYARHTRSEKERH